MKKFNIMDACWASAKDFCDTLLACLENDKIFTKEDVKKKMGGIKRFKQLICSDIENVENYEKAKADNFKGWICHHRLETHTSDGERRLVDISPDELIALDVYYHRPAEELIFMPIGEHSTLHNKGKHHSEEHNRKIAESNKGKHSMSHSEEWNRKIGEAGKGRPGPWKGKHFSEETKRKMSESHKNKIPWNKGKPGTNKGKHWKLVEGKRVYY